MSRMDPRKLIYSCLTGKYTIKRSPGVLLCLEAQNRDFQKQSISAALALYKPQGGLGVCRAAWKTGVEPERVKP